MARKTRARRGGGGTSSVIEKSLRDAQKVIAGYMESGGKQVKDTLGSLVRIFENQHLTEALASGSRRISRAVTGRGSAKRRSTASRRSRGNARTTAGKTAAGAKRVAAKTRRSAAARMASAKRTKRAGKRK
jgi:hypothetical protein